MSYVRKGCLVLTLGLFCSGPLFAASRPPVQGTGGAVASDERLATDVGLEILRQGGNAADAAVATALALVVVEPEAGNLGGGGLAVIKFGDELTYLDFRETAPSAAHRGTYLDENGEPLAEASLIGPLAAGVPGSPSGLFELHRRFGKLEWRKVVEPARRLAADGFSVSRRLHHGLVGKKEVLTRFPETAARWFPRGEAPAAGSILRIPELAATLADYAERGPAAIIEGERAQAIEEISSRYGGILTAADLAAYEPVWRQPARFEAFGWQVASADLPSSGGILVGSAAGILDRLGWHDKPRFGADRAHLIAEAWRRAFADRFLLGDPATAKAGAGELLADSWLDQRTATVDRTKASASSSVEPWDGAAVSVSGMVEPQDTTHLSTVDRDGNLVALTTTLNGSFGCALYVPEAGFFLNNEMDDFATAPGRPNLYGLVQGEANEVGPGKRMLSSMSPTVAWREGEAIALGGRGGSRIPTSTLQVLLNFWLDGDGLQAALDRPRVHHQWLPDQIFAEPDALAPETQAELESRGHHISSVNSLAQVHAVRWTTDGQVEAAVDPRGGGGASGVVRPLY
ncbi:MAG: gamma-glutamyltransferase [Acidobacteriota bacterium]